MTLDFGWTPEVLAQIDQSVREFSAIDRTHPGWWRDTLIEKFIRAYEAGYLTDPEIRLLSMLPKNVQEKLCVVYIQGKPTEVHLGLAD